MLSYTSNEDSITFILDSEDMSNEQILQLIKSKLSCCNINAASSICADTFTYNGRTLVIAYPTPPLRERVDTDAVRLRRMR